VFLAKRQYTESSFISRLLQYIGLKTAVDVGVAGAAQMSSHSLRIGFATESAIQQRGRLKSTQTVLEYIGW